MKCPLIKVMFCLIKASNVLYSTVYSTGLEDQLTVFKLMYTINEYSLYLTYKYGPTEHCKDNASIMYGCSNYKKSVHKQPCCNVKEMLSRLLKACS